MSNLDNSNTPVDSEVEAQVESPVAIPENTGGVPKKDFKTMIKLMIGIILVYFVLGAVTGALTGLKHPTAKQPTTTSNTKIK